MMSKCGCGKLCPVSFGLALGVAGALAVLIWAGWMMHMGVPPEMANMPLPDWAGAFKHAFGALVKGFVFGFVLAFLYDFFSCCMSKMCKKAGCCCNGGSCGDKK